MAIQYFQPEVWSATLLSALEKSLVYAGAPCVNRDYEGEIANFGDTVHIVSISDPTIGNYTKDTDITVQVLTDADRTLVIDQSKYFAFEIDDIDDRQSRNGGALMTEAAKRGAFGLRDVADQYVASKMLNAAGSALGVIDASGSGSPNNVYDNLLVPLWVALEQNNVPREGRFVVLPPAAYGKLLLDTRFIKANESGSTAGLRNGVVGMAAGFEILTSNNAPQVNRSSVSATGSNTGTTLTGSAGTFTQADVGASVTGTNVGSSAKISAVNSDGSVATVTVANTGSVTSINLSGSGQAAIAGSPIATTYAEQINKVEAFRPEKRFADALKGLHLYGAKVVRPEALVAAAVKVS